MNNWLMALARAPVADDRVRDELEKNASWLISVISWIPENKETTQFVESFSLIELLFDAALDALQRESSVMAKSARDLLIGWAFMRAISLSAGPASATGRHRPGVAGDGDPAPRR
jgi:hypothetical protein